MPTEKLTGVFSQMVSLSPHYYGETIIRFVELYRDQLSPEARKKCFTAVRYFHENRSEMILGAGNLTLQKRTEFYNQFILPILNELAK